VSWRESRWGRLRYSLALANLLQHLDAGPLRVLDIGGGDGGDAIPLAKLGHHVTIIDSAPDPLTVASEWAAEAGVSELLDIVESDVFAVADVLAGGRFDVVLCHDVVQHVEDVSGLLKVALAASKPGGLLSIIVPNVHSEPMVQAVRELDPDAALKALDTDESIYTAGGLTLKLTELGCVVIGHYGLQAVSDYISDSDLKQDADFFAKLERFEHAVTDRAPYKHTARNFQLTAVRPV
jgi:S-adenosylmethionine-dependent methyltransferase